MAKHYIDNHLNNFLKTARFNSLLEASRQIGLSQPALSRSLDTLEANLGFKVCLRSRQGFQLTEKGQNLYYKIIKINAELMDTINNVKTEAQEISGDIFLGAHQSLLTDFVAPIYQKLSKRHPKARLHLVAKKSSEVLQEVRNSNLDFGLIINPVEFHDLIIRPICKTSAGFFSAQKDIESNELFLNPEMVDVHRLLKSFKQDFKDASMVSYIHDYDVIANLLKSGSGIGLLPLHVGQRFNLHFHAKMSAKLKLNYDLKLVSKLGKLSESRRQLLRELEELLKATL